MTNGPTSIIAHNHTTDASLTLRLSTRSFYASIYDSYDLRFNLFASTHQDCARCTVKDVIRMHGGY